MPITKPLREAGRSKRMRRETSLTEKLAQQKMNLAQQHMETPLCYTGTPAGFSASHRLSVDEVFGS